MNLDLEERTMMTGLSILLVEDDAGLRKQLTAFLTRKGADVEPVGDLKAARLQLSQGSYDFLLLDVNLPDGSGLELLKEDGRGQAGVIIMTSEAAVSDAVEAIRAGALDYLCKPFDPAQLSLVVERSQRRRQHERVQEHESSLHQESQFFFSTGLEPVRRQVMKILEADARLLQSLPPLLIEGETGTGKSTLARIIHYSGPRKASPLVEVNCSALPESLAEAELFGYEKGAFTDARSAKMGLFQAAENGTLFLDELSSLSLGLQAKILTAIEDHKIRKLGGTKTFPVEVRIIAASNTDLAEAVRRKEFREDLFHRLNLYRICIPPLRDRSQDALDLAAKLLVRLAQKHRVPFRRLSQGAQANILSHGWRGNVRELSHELERALIFEEGTEIELRHLVAVGAGAGPAGAESGWFNESFVFPGAGAFDIEEAISRIVRHALRQSGNNVSEAARLLGASRDYVRYRLGERKSQKEEGGGRD